MRFLSTEVIVKNRGTPPVKFLTELVNWGKSAAEEIFASRPAPKDANGKPLPDPDVYFSVLGKLGPWTSPQYRRAAMLEIMRVLAGFESSWNWDEGVDRANQHSQSHITGQETGAWQVSYDSLPFGADLKECATRFCGAGFTVESFIDNMKSNHIFAMEYIARLLRHTCRHNGPVLRHDIDPWLSKSAAAEFQSLLS